MMRMSGEPLPIRSKGLNYEGRVDRVLWIRPNTGHIRQTFHPIPDPLATRDNRSTTLHAIKPIYIVKFNTV